MAPDQLEAFQAKLAALTADCADIPPRHLERAIADWVRESPFLPKASELIAKARNIAQGGNGTSDRDSHENAQRLADQANARLKGEGKWSIHWVVDEQNALKLEQA